MHTMRLIGAIATALATALLIVVQFVPFGGVHQNIGGADIKGDAYVWEAKSSVSYQGQSQSEDQGWFDSEYDDTDGAGKVRTGAIFFVIGLVFIALGAVLQFVLRGPIGPGATLLGVALTLVGVIIFSVGVGDLLDGEQDWLVGFYFAIVALVLGLGGAVLGLLPDDMLPTFKSKGGPSF